MTFPTTQPLPNYFRIMLQQVQRRPRVFPHLSIALHAHHPAMHERVHVRAVPSWSMSMGAHRAHRPTHPHRGDGRRAMRCTRARPAQVPQRALETELTELALAARVRGGSARELEHGASGGSADKHSWGAEQPPEGVGKSGVRENKGLV